MKLHIRRRFKRAGLALAVSGVITIITGLGLFSWLDNRIADAVYQKREATSGNIVVIGIDETALQEYGPFQSWDRNIMASALEQLSSDPDNMPAVVAIDTLYSGERGDDSDVRLAEAAEKLGCVVTAGSAAFGTTREINEEGKYVINDHAIMTYEESYDALKEVTDIGHINAMYDSDGILRHAILYVEPTEGEKVYSMAAVTAAKYLESRGEEVVYPETDSRGNYYVAYTGAPGDFYDGISIYDLVEGNVPSSYYAGKIVFIGPYAAGLADNVITPIDRSQNMYGVEFQANVVEQIISQNYKEEAPDDLQLLALFIVAAAALFVFMYVPIAPSTVIAVGLIAASTAVAILVYGRGTVRHILWTPMGVFIAYVLAVIVQYLRSREEKRMVTKTFERYVDTSIVNELLKEDTDQLGLGGKLCEIAVLFVDIRGFTTMSEHLDPETVVSILNKYLGMTSRCVHDNKGTLDKFVGDCTMAFWGAPLEMEDPIYYAVKCAQDIIDGAAEISKELQETLGLPLNVGVGVNFGPAVVGNIGADNRMDYTAIGDTVNTAARLESNAPAGKIYISRIVADNMGDRITTNSLGGTIKLKGKAEGFEVLEVTGWKE